MNNPELAVQFVLDDQGSPQYIESKNKKHYKIEVSLKGIPDDVYAANYKLDESYINPYREEMNKAGEFKFNTTTYGDYIISASLLGKKRNYLTSNMVSRALREKYKDSNNPHIAKALKDIMDF